MACILVGWGNVETTVDRWRVSGLYSRGLGEC